MTTKLLEWFSVTRNITITLFALTIAVGVLTVLAGLHFSVLLLTCIAGIVIDLKQDEIAEACQYALSIDDE